VNHNRAVTGGVGIIPPQLVSTILVHPLYPFDDLQPGLGRMTGNNDITDKRVLVSISFQIYEDFIIGREQG
jgi:hypothetical protein